MTENNACCMLDVPPHPPQNGAWQSETYLNDGKRHAQMMRCDKKHTRGIPKVDPQRRGNIFDSYHVDAIKASLTGFLRSEKMLQTCFSSKTILNSQIKI